MKRIVLIAVLLLFPCLSAQVPAQTSGTVGRPLVVFIHGRNQMWLTEAEMNARWFGAFSDGLEKLSPDAQSERRYRDLIPLEDRVLVRYERVYEPGFTASAQCGGKTDDPIGKLAARQYDIDVFMEGLQQAAGQSSQTDLQRMALGRLDTAADKYASAVTTGYSSRMIEKASALTRILHGLRDGAGRVFGASAGTAFLADTKLYLLKGPLHCETNVRLKIALDQAAAQHRPVIIVAHSMGAMVTLDQLWRSSGADYNVVRFVSLGAQLGMPDLLRYLAGAGADRPLLPGTITDWVNIKGESDLLGYTVAPETVRFVQGGPPANVVRDTGTLSNAHNITRYLQLRETAHAIADAYCGAFTGPGRPTECVGVRPFPTAHAGS